MKTCTRCGTTTDKFAKRSANKDGLASVCKTCTSIYKKIYAQKKTSAPQLKRCTKCNIIKKQEEFYKNKYSVDTLHRWCKECDNLRLEIYRNTLQGRTRIHSSRKTNGKYSASKAKAKSNGIEWSLSKDDYTILLSMPCTYCRNKIKQDFGYGITRLDNDKGFEPGNVITCCKTCNKIKASGLSYQEMTLIGETISRLKSNSP